VRCLGQYSADREADIERIGLTKHEEFLDSVGKLQSVREGTVALTAEILTLNQSIQASTEKLAEQKEALVNTKAIRQNIADAAAALKESLKILHAVNHAHDLAKGQHYYAALKSLDDLQNEHLVPILQNRYATQHRLADVIQKSIPASQKIISEAVMNDLNTWLYRIRETSQFLGEVAFYHTELRRSRYRKRADEDSYLSNFKLNSAIELVYDESEEFDVLNNDEVQVDFTPLFEALHIHEALGQVDKFRAEYAATRRQQKDLLLPSSVALLAEDESSLSSLLEGIAGFAIIEKATMRKVPHLRSSVDVSSAIDTLMKPLTITLLQIEEIWESMCNAAIKLTSKALNLVSNAEELLKVKGFIALFIQTMEVSNGLDQTHSGTSDGAGLGLFCRCARQLPSFTIRKVRRASQNEIQRRLSGGTCAMVALMYHLLTCTIRLSQQMITCQWQSILPRSTKRSSMSVGLLNRPTSSRMMFAPLLRLLF
jgi:hypothetical protein